jgi:hypothetical protein
MKFHWYTLASLLFSLAIYHPAHAATGEVYLEIMGAPGNLKALSPGHGFVCISLHLTSAVKEECLGFYPKENGAKAFVGAPGVVLSEFQKNPTRFSGVTISLKKKITEDQQRAIYRVADDWNKQDYNFTNHNCLFFVNAVAGAAGLKKIEPGKLEVLKNVGAIPTPVKFVQDLKQLNP